MKNSLGSLFIHTTAEAEWSGCAASWGCLQLRLTLRKGKKTEQVIRK